LVPSRESHEIDVSIIKELRKTEKEPRFSASQRCGQQYRFYT
jgi:hypothetical protein